MVPKRIAMQKAEQISRAVVPAIDAVAKVWKPSGRRLRFVSLRTSQRTGLKTFATGSMADPTARETCPSFCMAMRLGTISEITIEQ